MGEAATSVAGVVVLPGKDVHLVLALLERGAQLPAVLSGILRCAEAGVELLDVWTTRGELATAVMLSVASESVDSLRAFSECVRGVQGVAAASYKSSRARGLVVESWGFPVLPATGRVLVLEGGFFGSMLRESWRLLGRSLSLTLYNASFTYGKSLYERLVKLGAEREQALYLASEVLRHAGLGSVVWESLGDGRAVAVVRGNVECGSMAGVAGYESSIVRGVVAGLLGGLWGVERNAVEARETSCISRGDEVCRIEVSLRARK